MFSQIRHRVMMLELYELISRSKLIHAVRKLANGKSPGLNDVLPDAFKALDKKNLLTLHAFFCAY